MSVRIAAVTSSVSEYDHMLSAVVQLTKFVHRVSMFLIEGEFHENTDGRTDLMVDWRWHWTHNVTQTLIYIVQ